MVHHEHVPVRESTAGPQTLVANDRQNILRLCRQVSGRCMHLAWQEVDVVLYHVETSRRNRQCRDPLHSNHPTRPRGRGRAHACDISTRTQRSRCPDPPRWRGAAPAIPSLLVKSALPRPPPRTACFGIHEAPVRNLPPAGFRHALPAAKEEAATDHTRLGFRWTVGAPRGGSVRGCQRACRGQPLRRARRAEECIDCQLRRQGLDKRW